MTRAPTTFADEAQQGNQWVRDMSRIRQGSSDTSDAARASRARMESVDLAGEVEEQAEEIAQLREQLTKSKALNRLSLIQNKGLLDTVRHLRRAWNPTDPAEAALKDDMKPLLYGKIDEVAQNPEELKKIDEKIEQTTAVPRRRGGMRK